MDRRNLSEPDAFNRLVAWIETRLGEPLTLEQIATRASLSPCHFSRLFTARMGRSVMAHVRGRRLVRGARRLVDEPDLKLVELALDCGFESQEGFTRAFKRVFGVAPGRFRDGFAVNPVEGQYPMNLPAGLAPSVVQLPELVALDRFSVAGPSRRFDESTKSEIPRLWSSLVALLPLKGQLPNWVTYGVVWSVDREEGSFQYMAGVGVEPGCDLPQGFTEMQIPAATYVVFRITLTEAPVHEQIKGAMATIWGELIPASGRTPVDGPDFERYDGRFDPKAGATIDFHVPVAP